MEFSDTFLERLRLGEEEYAKQLSGKSVRVSFTSGDYSFTDGSVIIVNPFLDQLYCNVDALRRTEEELQISNKFSENREHALRLITRLQVIHESLHVKYSEIPSRTLTDEYAKDPRSIRTLSLINGIIEDAYIENVGCTMGKTMEQYLMFYRLLQKNAYWLDENQSDGKQRLGDQTDGTSTDTSQYYTQESPLVSYLNYMAKYTLFPMIRARAHASIGDYVEKSGMLFLQGATTANPEKRYSYTHQVFEIIQELLREFGNDTSNPHNVSEGKAAKRVGLEGLSDREDSSQDKRQLSNQENDREESRELISKLGHSLTHSEPELAGNSRRKPPDFGPVDKSLFEDWMDKEISSDHQEINRIYFDLYEDSGKTKQEVEELSSKEYACGKLHEGIALKIVRTEKFDGYKSIYDDIYRTYHSIIFNYRGRISQLLHDEVDSRIEKCYLGTGIDSKRLSDVKKRYWYKRNTDEDRPELAVIFMVDCSHSMSGGRIDAVRRALIIMNEVLKGQGIDYAIFGHSAVHRKPEVVHNLVLDFDARDADKYNIMLLKPMDGSREGVSLLWADDYLARNAENKKRLIVAISDGEPNHYVSDRNSYSPPASVIDTHKVVKDIEKHGTKVVAVALESGGKPCYDQLIQIYDDVIECRELSRLPKQLLELISEKIKQN